MSKWLKRNIIGRKFFYLLFIVVNKLKSLGFTHGLILKMALKYVCKPQEKLQGFPHKKVMNLAFFLFFFTILI